MAIPVGESTPDIGPIELDLLLTAIERRYGYDFRDYAPGSLERRVLRAAQLEGTRTISELQSRILRDPACMQRFVDTLSVGCTSMFRDPEFFRALRAAVVPLLRSHPFVRIWHAGCATGQEVYSMAILLHEEGLYGRCRVYATDISNDALARAKRGVFPLATMRANTTNYQQSGGLHDFSTYYTTDSHGARFDPALRRNVVFSHHNLVSDGSFNEFHLILCRNVLIYFGPDLRTRVLDLIYASSARHGIIGVGQRESLDLSHGGYLFARVVPGAQLFQRRS